MREWYVPTCCDARRSALPPGLKPAGFRVHCELAHDPEQKLIMDNLIAVTAIGPDRTGLVRDVTHTISSAGGSILQSRMTTLGQEFAILALVSGNWHAIRKITAALQALNESTELTVTLRETASRTSATPAAPYNVDIVAMDQEGIVASLANFFAARQIEIADLSTRQYNAPHTGADMFAVQLAINVPATQNIASLREDFHDYCEEQNLDAIIEPMQR